jgi:6-phospho-3-hexuloisomerase
LRGEIESALEYLCTVAPLSLKMNDRGIKALEEMIESITTAKKIFLYGVGRSGLVAKGFAIRLVQLGLNVFFIGESNTPMVEKDSLVIILSNTGQTMSAVQTANITRRIGAKVIAITSDPHSKLANAASDVILIAGDDDGSDERKSFAPLGTAFEEASWFLLDAILAVLMKKLGETDHSMRKRHAIWV